MVDITKDDLIKIHEIIQETFNITPGIKDDGLLESIAERPSQNPYNHTPFPDIYSKCASLMEAIIKWHPFIDGNKRSGLHTAHLYMYVNGYTLVIPVSAVRFSVLVAQDKKDLHEITKWIRKLSAGGSKQFHYKMFRYFLLPLIGLSILSIFSPKKARKITEGWLAFDIYPEYRNEQKKTLAFIYELMNIGMKNVTKTGTRPLGQTV